MCKGKPCLSAFRRNATGAHAGRRCRVLAADLERLELGDAWLLLAGNLVNERFIVGVAGLVFPWSQPRNRVAGSLADVDSTCIGSVAVTNVR